MRQPLPLYLYIFVFFGLVVANVSIYTAVFAQPVLEVRVFTIGKGNAALVRTPDSKTLLVDTGSDASILRALGGALPVWKRKIDTVLLTSADAKSKGGLPSLTDRYRVSATKQFGVPELPYGTPVGFDTVRVTVAAPHVFTVSYGQTSLSISSTTPEGVYRSDGTAIKQ